MAVDLTPAFHVALYILFGESILFFAVIMQTKSVDPATHSGIARYFGMVFLFEAVASLFVALSEQLFDSDFSHYFAIAGVGAVACAVALSVPAAAYVAVPEPGATMWRAAALAAWLAVLAGALVLGGPTITAVPDVPYVTGVVRRDTVAAVVAAAAVLAIAAGVRMLRPLKGRNGAFILVVGMAVAATCAVAWAHVEPLCRLKDVGDVWRQACPLPKVFDHNFVMVVVVMLTNILVAEGVLRLMAAGSGVEGYGDIAFIPVVRT